MPVRGSLSNVRYLMHANNVHAQCVGQSCLEHVFSIQKTVLRMAAKICAYCVYEGKCCYRGILHMHVLHMHTQRDKELIGRR